MDNTLCLCEVSIETNIKNWRWKYLIGFIKKQKNSVQGYWSTTTDSFYWVEDPIADKCHEQKTYVAL